LLSGSSGRRLLLSTWSLYQVSADLSSHAMSERGHSRPTERLRGRDGTVRAVRLGCGGCLSTVGGLVAVGVLTVAGGWAVVRLFEPPVVEAIRFAPDDGVRAQQKIFDLARRRTRAGAGVRGEAAREACGARHL